MQIFNLSVFWLTIVLFLLTGCGPTSNTPNTSWEHAIEGAYTAVISDDAAYSVVSSIHHGISLWDLKNNALKYQWNHQQDVDNLVLTAHISQNNSHVLTADRKNFTLWSIETGKAEGYWQVRESDIRDVAVSNNGNHLLIGKSNGVVVHITLATGRRLEFIGHQEKINSVALSPNGRYALTGSNDYTAFLWDTQSGQVIYRFTHPSRVTRVALDPKGRIAFTADSQKKAQIWDLTTGKPVSTLSYTARQQIFSAVRFNNEGTLLATGAPTSQLALWDVASGKKLQSWRVTPRKNSRPKGAVVYSVAFSNNDAELITESSAGLAESWTIETR